MSKLVVRLTALLLFSLANLTHAAHIGLGSNQFYTSTLASNLKAQGNTVTVVDSYSAASLAGLDVYIQDGNSFFNRNALDDFVFKGGTLIEVPWSFSQPFTTNTTVFGRRSTTSFGQSNPAITALDPASWLLNGVTLPAAGASVIGREVGNAFSAGTTRVLQWNDGTALLGYKNYGAGVAIGFNIHLITSDAHPLNAAWSNQIVYNAVNGPAANVPEPASLVLMGAGLLGLMTMRRRRRNQA